MINEKNKSYSSEFRESSVKLALGSELPIAQTARELGVNSNTLYIWISKYSQPKENTLNQNKSDEYLYDQLKRLKKENARLKEEWDIFKKAALYSSGHCNTKF